LYDPIGNIRKDIHQTLKKHGWICIGLIPCQLSGGKSIVEARDVAVGTVLCPQTNLDITGLARNRILLMDSQDNVILFWLPGSGIIQNKSWLLKFQMPHT